MKVCINNLEGRLKNLNIGPVIFTKRLARELGGLGVEMVERDNPHDILLVVGDDSNTPGKIDDSRKKGAKIIQRLDGIYHIPNRGFSELNKPIKENFQKTDAVIYQSEFSKKMVEKYFGKNKNQHFVIPNGANPNEFYDNSNKNGKTIFLCSAKWREEKRLKSTVEGFEYSKIPNSELWVLGEPDYLLERENIVYFKEIDSKKLSNFYNQVDFFIHLCYDDPCPNSVIEALVSRLPVICTSNGGTKELVKNSGEVILEEEYDLEPYYSGEVPEVDKVMVKEALLNCIKKRDRYDFPREDLYIENIAKRYKQSFEEVLDSR